MNKNYKFGLSSTFAHIGKRTKSWVLNWVCALVMFGSLAISQLQAQIAVTVTNNTNTTPNLTASYTSLANALTALNGVTAMTGPVTLTLAAGGSETAPPTGLVLGSATLNPVLSAINTITIVKAAGAATVLNAGVGTATPGSAAPDGILSLRGADFVTIDGLTFTDGNTTNPATMEYGLGLFKFSAGDGANNNTIQNCIFNMQRVNNATATAPMVDGSVAILVINSIATAATTALTPTNGGTLATNGTNSNNKFYTNTTNGGNYGIVLNGFAATVGVGPAPVVTTFLGDLGNDIGGVALGTGNTILNYGGGAAAANPAAGICATNQWGVNISYNSVDNNNGSGVNHVSTLRGIFAQSGTSANATITNNTVSIKGGGTASAVTAIENIIGSTAAANTVNINNNIVQNCTYTTGTTGTFTAIINSATPATLTMNGNTFQNSTYTGAVTSGLLNGIISSATAIVNINNNTVNNLTTASTGTCLAISVGSPTGIGSSANGNTITNITRTSAAGGIQRCLVMTSPNVAAPNAMTFNNNTINNITFSNVASTGAIDAIFGTTSSTNVTINNNIISNLSTPNAGAINGIREFGTTGNKVVQNNTIFNFNTLAGGAGGATMTAIVLSAGTVTVSGNKIYGINSLGALGTTIGITVSAGTGPHNINNNIIGGLTTPAANGTNANIGINLTNTNTNNVYYNTIYLNSTSSSITTFGNSCITFSTSPTSVDLRNNILVNTSTPAQEGANVATNGQAVCLRRSAGTAATVPANYATTSNNNLFWSNPTAGTNNHLVYAEGTATLTNPMNTVANLKAFMVNRDQASVSENPTFLNTTIGANANYLHIDPTVATAIESGALNISGFPNDFDGDIRFGNAGTTSTGFGTDIGADEFNGISIVPACNGAPSAGTASASITTTCLPTFFTLTLTGITAAPGLSYQWQTSPNGISGWTNITGAISSVSLVSITTTSFYRCLVTCANPTATSTPSNSVQVTVNAPSYASLPYIQGFESVWSSSPCAIAPIAEDIPDAFWRNTPVSGNNSWRADNTNTSGVPSGWGSVTSYIYSPTGSQSSSRSARFHSGNASGGLQGSLDLYVNLSAAGNKQLSFDYINTSGTDVLAIFLSEDGGITFTPVTTTPAALGIAAAWTNVTATLSSVSSTAVLRFRATADFGSTDIGLDNISLTPPCSGTPLGGTSTVSLNTICAPTPLIFSLSGATSALGISYQWQSSSNGISWVDVIGATTSNPTIIVSATMQYRCVVTCANPTPSSSNSIPVSVTFTGATYASIPYIQGFESVWSSSPCAIAPIAEDIPDAFWRNTPVSGNNSWRADNTNTSGVPSGWGSVTSYIYSPTGSQSSSRSARFHSGNASGGLQGSLDLYVNLSAAGNKQLSFDYINTSGTDVLAIFLSEDGGITFTPVTTTPAALGIAAAWTNVTATLSSVSSTAVLRFRATADFGSTDIGLDNLSITFPCNGTPTAGTTITNAPNVCLGGAANLSLTGNTIGSGISYQWQSATTLAGPYTNISGATSSSYTATNILAATFYQCVVTCANPSVSSVNSTPVQVSVILPTYATLPYSQSFENTWLTTCVTAPLGQDTPDASWRGVNTSGDADANWRADNTTPALSGWGTSTSGGYTPVAQNGLRSARFHSYDVTAGLQGSLDLYVDLSTAGTKQLSFWYINPISTSDRLEVLLSTDGGATFGAPLLTTPALAAGGTAVTAWTNVTFNLTTTSATCVIRFRGTGDFSLGAADIGLDNVSITPPCTGTPTAGTSVSSSAQVCAAGSTTNLSLTGATLATGLTYQWQSSATTGTGFVDIPGAINPTFTATVNATTFYRCIVSCGANPATSTEVSVSVFPPVVLPLTQGFNTTSDLTCWRINSNVSGTATVNITDAFVFPTTLPSEGDRMVLFNSYNIASGGQARIFSPLINTTGTTNINVGFKWSRDNGYNTTNDNVQVQYSLNGTTWVNVGTAINRPDATLPNGSTTGPAIQVQAWTQQNVVLPLGAENQATLYVGFLFTSANGNNSFLDDIRITTPCSGTPAAGTINVPSATVCRGNSVNLNLTGASVATGVTYQWQSSATVGGPYTNITGATNIRLDVPMTTATFYQCVVTCTTSTLSATTVPVQVSPVNATYATVPYTQSFETTWVNGCGGTNSVPDASWTTYANTTNNFWRKDDDATSPWGAIATGVYTPTGSAGTRSARFHSANSLVGTKGGLDLFIDLSSPFSKSLSFSRINASGTDVLNVSLSTDGGNTFTPITGLSNLGVAAAWTASNATLTTTSATSIIRFEGTADLVASDIGLDNVQVSIICPLAAAVTFAPTLSNATFNSAYTPATLTALPYTAAATWSITAGALPTGMSLSAAGVLSGTPTQVGTFNFTAQVAQSGCTATNAYTLVVDCPASITFGTTPANGTVGVVYSQTLTQTGLSTPTWSISAGALPTGLTLDGATGIISGTPTVSGSYTFTVQAQQFTCSYTQVYTIVIGCPVITISPATLPSALVNTVYSQVLSANGTGLTNVYTFALTSGTVVGMSFNAATATWSGTPTATGTYPLTFMATDNASGCSTTINYSFVVACATPTFTPSTLANATVGTSVNVVVSQTGANPPFTWSLGTGTLPTGVTFDAAMATLSGTPTVAGTYTFEINLNLGGCTVPQPYTWIVNCPTITFTNTTATAATVGTVYNINAGVTGNTLPITYSVLPALPVGLTLDTSTGVITGTPTAVTASTSYVVTATQTGVCTVTNTYTFAVNCPVITLTPTPAVPATLLAGTAVSYTFAVGGSTTAITLSTTGTIPTGMTFNAATGVLSGTPNTTGAFTFAVVASQSGPCSVTNNYTINVNCPVITVTPATIPTPVPNIAYTQVMSTTGNTSAVVWSQTGTLPTGITFDAATGTFSGTATALGTFTGTVTATQTNGPCPATRNYTWNVACPVASITTATLPVGFINVPYTTTLAQAGYTGTISWSATGLPTGMTMNATTGVISGTTTVFGTNSVSVTLTQGLCSITKVFGLQINSGCPAILLNPSTMPAGNIGAVYTSTTIVATGGVAPYVFSVSNGTLPAGLSITPAGVISGTPTATGTANVNVTATDANGCTGSALYVVTINAACTAITITPATLNSGIIGLFYNQTLTSTGGTAPYSYVVTTGTLPTGLTLATNGALTGTVAAPATSTFSVRVTDAIGCTGTITYTLAINPVPTRVIALIMPTSPAPPLDSLKFLDVIVGQSGTSTFTIRNNGNSPLTISGIQYPTGFSGAFAGVIPAASSQIVTVTFAPSSVGLFSGTVLVNSDAISGTSTFTIAGNGINNVTAIEEFGKPIVTVYPNPSASDFNVRFDNNSKGNYTVKVLDLTGKVVFEDKAEITDSIEEIQLKLGHLANGTYLLHLENKRGKTAVRIVRR